MGNRFSGARLVVQTLLCALAIAALSAACGSSHPTERPTPVATVAQPSPTASATPVPNLAAEAPRITVASPRVLPAGWTLYAWHQNCFQCGGGVAVVRRWTSDGNTASGEFIYSFAPNPVGAPPDTPSVYSVAFADDGRRIAAALCTRGYCGGEAEPSPDATAELFRSDDAGRTWRNLGPLVRGSFLVGFRGEELVIDRTKQTDAGFTHTFVNTLGEPLAPSGIAPTWVYLASNREPVWVVDNRYQDAGGPVVPPTSGDVHLLALPGTDAYLWEVFLKDAKGQPSTVLAVSGRDGTNPKVLRWDGKWWSIRGVTSGRYLVGYGDDPSLGEAPAPFVIDLETATLTPLIGFPRSAAESYTFPRLIVPAP